MRAFLIGFPKSGTTTIHTALNASGVKSVHWKLDNRACCGPLIYKRHLSGQDPLLDLSAYAAVTQADACDPMNGINAWPNLDFGVLLNIRRHHPECVFILNKRDPAKIVESISRWSDLRQRLIESDIIGLPKGYGTQDSHLIRWIENHYAACAAVFSGDPNYVEFDMDDPGAPKILGDALNVSISWWGIANRNKRPAG